eukprot:SAG31_NODE_16731_length_698_cov_1.025042_1_plen_180_part_01
MMDMDAQDEVDTTTNPFHKETTNTEHSDSDAVVCPVYWTCTALKKGLTQTKFLPIKIISILIVTTAGVCTTLNVGITNPHELAIAGNALCGISLVITYFGIFYRASAQFGEGGGLDQLGYGVRKISIASKRRVDRSKLLILIPVVVLYFFSIACLLALTPKIGQRSSFTGRMITPQYYFG